MWDKKAYYTTQEFASAVGIHRNTVIRWHKLGKLIPHHVTVTGFRYYSQEQVDEVLKGLGNSYED